LRAPRLYDLVNTGLLKGHGIKEVITCDPKNDKKTIFFRLKYAHVSTGSLEILLSISVLFSHTGYGYTTPKTAQGKILTIFYALIGIPLVVLYLSNIGDYLADVFRALYSRTCRNTCENYCSISLFTSVVRSLVRRYYGKPVEDEIPNDEMIHIDGVAGGGNVPFRRRKRVLLKAFSLTDDECPHDESDLEANELSFSGVRKDPNHIQPTEETGRTPKTRCGPNIERLRTLFEEIGVYRVMHSPRLVSAMN
ncbi:Ion channel, partial [Opisthorchis viverrini]